MKASIGGNAKHEERLYREAEEHVYREAMLEVNGRKRHQAVLAAGQQSPPTPSTTRAQRRQAIVDRIAHHTRVDAWKCAIIARMACRTLPRTPRLTEEATGEATAPTRTPTPTFSFRLGFIYFCLNL
jgi:hypothetical protein